VEQALRRDHQLEVGLDFPKGSQLCGRVDGSVSFR